MRNGGLHWAQKRGATPLHVAVYDDNRDALDFYRAMGFQDRGWIKADLSTGDRKVLLLTLDLPATQASSGPG